VPALWLAELFPHISMFIIPITFQIIIILIHRRPRRGGGVGDDKVLFTNSNLKQPHPYASTQLNHTDITVQFFYLRELEIITQAWHSPTAECFFSVTKHTAAATHKQ
jgi:hypothetical protein